jgi:hypothetical protein
MRLSKFLAISSLMIFSSSLIAGEVRLSCSAASESYGPSWTGNKYTAQITTTIIEINNHVFITLSGDPNFIIGATSVSNEKFFANNYSTKNKYILEVGEIRGMNSTKITLDRVTGDLDVYSRVYVEELKEISTWRIYGKCKLSNSQRLF